MWDQLDPDIHVHVWGLIWHSYSHTIKGCASPQSLGGENVPWRVSEANKDYGMCETYPTLLGVPAAVSDEGLIQASQFRSKGRLPVSYLSLLALKYIAIHAYIGKQRDIHRTTNIACVFQNIQLHAHIRYMHTYTACPHTLHVHIYCMSTYTACAHTFWLWVVGGNTSLRYIHASQGHYRVTTRRHTQCWWGPTSPAVYLLFCTPFFTGVVMAASCHACLHHT